MLFVITLGMVNLDQLYHIKKMITLSVITASTLVGSVKFKTTVEYVHGKHIC